jgi:hypothetical protein
MDRLTGLLEDVRKLKKDEHDPEAWRRKSVYVDDCPQDLYYCDVDQMGNLGLNCPDPAEAGDPVFITRRGVCYPSKTLIKALPGANGERPTLASILNALIKMLSDNASRLEAEDPILLKDAVQAMVGKLGGD